MTIRDSAGRASAFSFLLLAAGVSLAVGAQSGLQVAALLLLGGGAWRARRNLALGGNGDVAPGSTVALECAAPRDAAAITALTRLVRRQAAVAAILLAWLSVVTCLSPAFAAVAHVERRLPGFLFGHILWAGAGLFVLHFAPVRSSLFWRRVLLVATVSLALGALAGVSQLLWGWKISGASIVAHADLRGRGFTSHPLTFAYASLLVFPVVTSGFLAWWRERAQGYGWIWGGAFASTTLCLVASLSRIALALAGVFFAWALWRNLVSRRQRLITAAVLVAALAVVGATENRISDKFLSTFRDSGEATSGYANDRVAFWHAHALMVAERPILGHGVFLDREHREPYYERLGLADFAKKYEAHNMYLQMLVYGGVPALALFFLWIVGTWQLVRQGLGGWQRQGAYGVLFCFVAGGMTQNAFQDSEVRYVLAVLVAFMTGAAARGKRE